MNVFEKFYESGIWPKLFKHSQFFVFMSTDEATQRIDNFSKIVQMLYQVSNFWEFSKWEFSKFWKWENENFQMLYQVSLLLGNFSWKRVKIIEKYHYRDGNKSSGILRNITRRGLFNTDYSKLQVILQIFSSLN